MVQFCILPCHTNPHVCPITHLRPACASHAPAMVKEERGLSSCKDTGDCVATLFPSPSPLCHLCPRNVLFNLVHESLHFLRMKHVRQAVSKAHGDHIELHSTIHSRKCWSMGCDTAHIKSGTPLPAWPTGVPLQTSIPQSCSCCLPPCHPQRPKPP